MKAIFTVLLSMDFTGLEEEDDEEWVERARLEIERSGWLNFEAALEKAPLDITEMARERVKFLGVSSLIVREESIH